MQRSEALRYMTGQCHLSAHTARVKIQEAVASPGEEVQIRTHITMKAIRVEKPGQQWEFVFGDTRY